uniref:WRKY domain-containing protein n=1 Tax=Kalanchoe fedtschenkoi TaxID=63787 RepID=A0A7N0UFV8_KALFE
MVMSGGRQEEQIWENYSSKIIVSNEIQRGVEAAKSLRILLMHHHHLNLLSNSQLSSSAQVLLEEIISSSERALSILKSCCQPGDASVNNIADCENIHNQQVSKKRKSTMMKFTKQVRVSLETGFDGTVEDGFNWRKYGQKDIQGANHPRGYYRCTHRQQAGCLATKHVQRSDEDPLLFYVTYRGKHTCYPQSETPPLLLPNRAANRSDQHYQTTCTTNTKADADVCLPPFPDDIYLLASSSSLLPEDNVGHFDSAGCCFQQDQNSPAGISESQVESCPDSDDGSHVSFDLSNYVLF